MASTSVATERQDERLVHASLTKRLFSRPEFGALAGAIVVWLFFAIAASRGFLSIRGTASYLEVSSHLGILSVAVALLMIGGEFDLSIGSIIGMAGVTIAILGTELGLSLPVAALIALVLSLAVGFFNGYMVVKTKLPSFIITLGSLFIVRGATIGFTRMITGRTQVGGLDDLAGYEILRAIFAYDIRIAGANFSVSILWWFGIIAVGTWLLLRTQVGNWIFGAGGAAEAARNVGVPVDRLKIGLFMTTAFAAWLVATIQVSSVKSADVLRGEQQEFLAIIGAVIGGNLLTGGYGSVIGAALGALIFGMVRQGIVFAGVDADWFQVFMGAMLVIAVLVNNYIRRRAEASRR
ncbi:MAG: ABC transporter permease [Anaerolineales bacterium]|nr:ABC transporter permease [Anaerolineales bacterium]